MMKKRLSDIVQKVVLGSIAGILSNGASANSIPYSLDTEYEGNDLFYRWESSTDLSPKLILKKNESNELTALSHRSHRSHSSHSSHRSHYSSYSGGGSSGSSGYSTRTSTGTSSSTNYSTRNEIGLGGRVLKRGSSGADVTELVNILLKKGYLKLDDGGTYVSGIYTYDKVIEDAVKRFQEDNGLEIDGICGSSTVYYLKNK